MMNEQTISFDERLDQIPPLFTNDKKDEEQLKTVANYKRLIEYYMHDPDFRSFADKDLAQAIETYKIDVDPEKAKTFMFQNIYKLYEEAPEKVPLELLQYFAFYKEKINWRTRSQEYLNVPENIAFKKWRKRQINRCWGEFSGANAEFVHVPVVFELSLGCSVGCPFCALASQKLEKNFQATSENIALWTDVLKCCKEIIGSAAGEGVCYFASEPLDNPDYEKFIDIYRQIFGRTPQITTAIAMRNPERTRELIKPRADSTPIIHRFSILTLKTFRDIVNFFTPEELLYVELLGRHKESLMYSITKAGRSFEQSNAANTETEILKTISCASGFIINMADKSIRLSTPCNADEKHPTGEIVIGKYYFSDIHDFKTLLLKIIADNMPLSIDMQKKLSFQKFYRYEETFEGFTLYGASKFAFKFQEPESHPFYRQVGAMIKSGKYTGREIAVQVNEATGTEFAVIFNFIRYLYNAGALI